MSRKRPTAYEVLAPIKGEPSVRELVGTRECGDPDDELQHFYLCQACQQPVDMRDLAAVLHHEAPGHEPLAAEDAERLVRISEQLRRSLERRSRDDPAAKG